MWLILRKLSVFDDFVVSWIIRNFALASSYEVWLQHKASFLHSTCTNFAADMKTLFDKTTLGNRTPGHQCIFKPSGAEISEKKCEGVSK